MAAHNKSYPLPIYIDDERQTAPTRGRGGYRGRGRSRGPRSRPPSRTRGPPNLETSEDIQTERRGVNADLHHSREHNRGRGRGGDSRGRRGTGSSVDRRPRNESKSRQSSNKRNYSDADIADTGDRYRPVKYIKEARPMSLQKVVTLSSIDSDPDMILMEISHSQSGFDLMFSSRSFQKHAFYIVRLLAAASATSNVHTLREFLEKIIELSFLTELNTFLNSVITNDQSHVAVWNSKIKLDSFCRYCAEVVKVVMSSLPSQLAQCFGVYSTLKQVCCAHDLQTEFDDVLEVFETVKQQREKKTETRQIPRHRKVSTDPPSEQPPENFRTIPIFPSIKDIHTDEAPFLRANKAKGKYESLDTYLDIQFRLLREDYLRPLRDGIYEYRSNVSAGRKVERSRNIRVYKNVQILRPVCASRGINHVIQFDSSQFKNMNWTSSRRLIFGSLVCLSCDNFETVHYATISERNATDLSEGCVEVHFETQASEALNTSRNETFVMAETTAYFEAYRYILEGLQEIEDPLPFSSYILDCSTNVEPPEYLKSNYQCYDFSCLLPENARFKSFPVLNTDRWPSSADLNLDGTQYSALQTAITNEFAIIQGPPGTGKTYVGLKIVQLLLQNSTFWNQSDLSQDSPILVVCYTNHALDQFLEGILSLCNDTDIIRIGGRCKNEALEPYTLANVKKEIRESKKRKFAIMQRERDCRKNVKIIEEQITQISKTLKKTTTRLIPAERLQGYMSDDHYNSFKTRNADVWHWLNCPHLQKQSIPEVNHEQSIRQEWTMFVLNDIQPMQEPAKQAVSNIWQLNLAQRAELYKSWITEGLRNIERYRLVDPTPFSCREYILTLNQLARCLTDPLSLHRLNEMSNCPIQVPVDVDPVEVWLCLFRKKTATSEMRSVMDTYVTQQSQGDTLNDEEDLEEERALDDDDDFMFETSKDRRSNQNRKNKENDEEWISARNEKKKAHGVRLLLKKARPISETEVSFLGNIWTINQDRRCSLYVYWLNMYRQRLKETVKELELQYNWDVQSLLEVRDQETVEVLKGCGVMGMTTTGAAKYRKLLQKVEPKLIIVEEAAEVLESHIIATLNANCKHLILIGDHKQLRPSTTVYELSKKYALDISLFERMVRNEVPCVTLEEQHRMRPEISSLMRRDSLYPKLRDHESVFKYDSVKGVETNIQFITHTELETDSRESTSYSNPHEAKYTAELARYFLNQGYEREQITILTPYMGQVLLLRKEMPRDVFEGVKITAVDNYQGEENDIIILSLVRSSNASPERRNPIGFVGIENRICVSLSRAKQGLFVIGNFSLIEACSPMWSDIIFDMRELGFVKEGLVLRCSNHPEEKTVAKSPVDFKNAPEGGCRRPCGKELPCGHICPKHCHVTDLEHINTACTRPCTKIVCDNGHRCTKQCFKKCGACLTKVIKIIPGCLHTVEMYCMSDPELWKCQAKCLSLLPCGHKCQRTCNDCLQSGKHTERCIEMVTKTMLCDHTVNVECFKEADSTKCNQPCLQKLDCGHDCSGKCGSCYIGRIHRPCKGTCNKIRPCGHNCSYPCTEVCPPCTRACGWKCSHDKKCKKKCFQPCDDCTENCRFKCEHGACENECKAVCSVSNCEETCQKRNNCKHECFGFCGEACVCILCDEKLLRNPIGQVFDEKSVFVQLPDCKCIFEASVLDRYMATPTTTTRGDFTKRCPHCQRSIQTDIRRYSKALKAVRKSINVKYESLYGGDNERLVKVKQIQSKMASLEQSGMEKSTLQQLRVSIQVDSIESIRGFEKKYAILLEILKFSKSSEYTMVVRELNSIPMVMNADELMKVVVTDRKFTAAQYWKEVGQEVKRLIYATALVSLKNSCMIQKNKYAVVEPLVTETINVLRMRRFDDRSQKLIHSSIGLAKSTANGTTITSSLDVTQMVLDLKQEQKRESVKIQSLFSETTECLANDPPAQTESRVESEWTFVSSNERGESTSEYRDDAVEENITDSDFTGTIEIQMSKEPNSSEQSENSKAHNEQKVKPSHETDNEHGDNGANYTVEQIPTPTPRLSLLNKIISTDGNDKASVGGKSKSVVRAKLGTRVLPATPDEGTKEQSECKTSTDNKLRVFEFESSV